MPVTDQQARAIAFLATAARPHGATRWDEAGVHANILKVADRSLAAVTIAVMQAAEDRAAQTPGVIPTNGPHWAQARPTDIVTKPEHIDPAERCSICSQRQDRCRSVWADDHDFESSVTAARHKAARPPQAVATIVTDLRTRTDQPDQEPTDA